MSEESLEPVGDRPDPLKIKPGEILSSIVYYKVNNKRGSMVNVVNLETNQELSIADGIVTTETWSSDQYSQTEKITQTQIAELLRTIGDDVFTVQFHKKVTPQQVVEKLNELNFKPGETKKSKTQKMKQAMEGEVRNLRGHIIHSIPQLGRSQVVDLDIPSDQHNIRLVDHRTIVYIIYRGIKYEVK